MTAVRLRGVTVVHADGFVALDGIDVEVDDGEFVVVLGPSGCGKTTLLRVVAGLIAPTAGHVEIAGRDAAGISPRDREVAMVFQEYALYPHLNVAENLAFPLRLAGIERHEADHRIVGVARRLGLLVLLDRFPARLSGGQRQRVALGRALIREPSVMLMDEPLSNLDAKQRVERRSEIVFLHRRMRTSTLFVTHDRTEAMTMADRIVLMRGGRIVQDARPTELYRWPVDLFAADFLGAGPINVLAGRVSTDGPRASVRIGPAEVILDSDLRGAPAVPREVAVGIRPEAFLVDPAGPITAGVVAEVVENGERIVHAVVDVAPWSRALSREDVDVRPRRVPDHSSSRSAQIVFVTAPETVLSPWEPVRLRVEPSGVHLFDPATGRALVPAPDEPSVHSRP